VVVAYRPNEWLGPCLEAVAEQTDELIVVDNASPGGTIARTARAAGARVVRTASNLGLAGGVNVGLRHARGDVIAMLNDDAIAGKGWLPAAAAVLDDPDVAAVCPKLHF